MINATQQHLLLQDATEFIKSCYSELGKSELDMNRRITEIEMEIKRCAVYKHSLEELIHGAKMAWRNSNRCIGRLFWESLAVIDARHIETVKGMAEALFQHIEQATNGGKVKPLITVFPQQDISNTQTAPRIWNHQLIRYAGYEGENGEIIGDPASISFTKKCVELGWSGSGTAFDILPLVISAKGEKPEWYSIPKPIALEVPLSHPELSPFAELGLRWYAVPFVSDMLLEIGGIRYTAAPFNGWYMGTEIGARNLADETRYNMLPNVARVMGLDTSKNSTLWKDRALVELNVAVLHSFKEQGVTIVDHHTAAQQFMRFERNETSCGRELTGRWSWLVPPLSPAATPIFHQSYNDRMVSPNFLHRPE